MFVTFARRFAVYATLPGRGVITAVGSADIRSNVVWETVDVPSWEGELSQQRTLRFRGLTH